MFSLKTLRINVKQKHMFKNRKKKKFYKHEINLIQEKLWRQGLRIVTVEKIREGIRMTYDRINGDIKQQEETLPRFAKEGNIPEESLKILDVEIKKQDTQTAEQYLETIHQHRKERWNAEMNRLLHICENKQEVKEALKKAGEKVFTLYETREGYKRDAENMREQMVGKFSPKENAHIGGIDQEIRQVESNIAGGEEFQHLIKEELKKL